MTISKRPVKLSSTPRKTQKLLPKWAFKVSWRATAVKLNVFARTYDEAQLKVERQLKKMEGGLRALDIQLVDVKWEP